jgi:hypothetical protein
VVNQFLACQTIWNAGNLDETAKQHKLVHGSILIRTICRASNRNHDEFHTRLFEFINLFAPLQDELLTQRSPERAEKNNNRDT